MKESAIRRMGAVLAAGRDIISFAPGYPAPDTFPWDEFRQIAAELLGRPRRRVAAVRTDARLPAAARRDHRDHGAPRRSPTKLEDLLVTTGSQQGLDLVARVLIDPGDVILVELPTYIGAISAFRNLQATLVGVPQEARRHRSRRARRDLRARPPRRAARASSSTSSRTSRTRPGC